MRQATPSPLEELSGKAPEGPSAPAPGTRALSLAFAVNEPARHPLSPRQRRGRLTTLTQASLTLQTARSLRPASHPTSRSRTGASLPLKAAIRPPLQGSWRFVVVPIDREKPAREAA